MFISKGVKRANSWNKDQSFTVTLQNVLGKLEEHLLVKQKTVFIAYRAKSAIQHT